MKLNRSLDLIVEFTSGLNMKKLASMIYDNIDWSGGAGEGMWEDFFHQNPDWREVSERNPNHVQMNRAFKQWFTRWALNRVDDIEGDIDWLIEGGWIEVWRMISVKPEWTPANWPLGVYWAYEEDAAEAHWGKYSGGYANVLLHAKVHQSQIDWLTTYTINASPDSTGEKEIRVRDGGWVNLIGITDSKGNAMQVRPGRYPVGTNDYVGESAKTI